MMHKISLLALLLLCLFLAACTSSVTPPSSVNGAVQPVGSGLDSTHVPATAGPPATNRPTLIMFEADGCPFCAQLRPVVNGLQTKYRDKVSFLYLDFYSPDGHRWADEYKVTGHPTIVTLDASGHLRRTMPGVLTQKQLESAIDDALK